VSDEQRGAGDGPKDDALGDTLIQRREPEVAGALADGRAPAPRLTPPSQGSVLASSLTSHPLAGRYLVLGVLGRGGMGTVTAAYDTRLDRRVALKLLHRREDTEGALQQIRLLREAQAMARLSHPNVVAVYDAGTLEDGTVFISMELVEGQTLRQWHEAQERAWRELLALYLEAGRGLAAAHEAGLVHRDFKPENVLVGKDGRVRVTDFGMARVGALPSAAKDPAEARKAALRGILETDPGLMMGTPWYMAPEVLSGTPVDERSDLFSFCVALYEALYRQPAFPGGDDIAARWEAHRQGRFNPPPAQSPVPAWVWSVVQRGMQVAPEQRPSSMRELIRALEDDPELRRRARLRAVGMGAGAVALVGLAVAGWMQEDTDRCQGMEQRLSDVWDEPLKAQVRKALLSTGLSYAGGTAERVQTALDGYAREWLRLRTELCEASQEEHGQPRDLAVLQVSCLERRRGQLGALVKLLARGPDPRMLPQAVQAVQSLPPLGDCMDAQALTTAVPLPSEPAARARAEALQEQVDRLGALWMAGKFQEGLELSAELLPQVEALDYAPLQAQALYHAGRLHGNAGNYDQAGAMLRKALVQAARGKDDVLLARVWNMVIWNAEVYQSRRPDVLDTEAMVLETAVERAGDELARAEALHILGGVLYKAARFEEARDRFQQARGLMEKELGPEHPFVAAMHNNIGVTQAELGLFEDARISYERALDTTRKALGPEHPEVANTLVCLGRALVRIGELSEAELQLQSGLTLGQRTLGSEHALIAEAMLGLGELHLARGRPAQALAPLERALVIRPPADSAETRFTLARALFTTGQDQARAQRLAADALEHYRRIGNHPKGQEVSRWLAEHFPGTPERSR
jgi:tetratricopeptide (TPR) repeat protein/predicted Ser/Thr protein kinase